MKFGTLFSYWDKDWACDAAGYARRIEKVAQIGFDVLEMSADHIYNMSDEELNGLNAVRKKHNIVITTNSGPAKEYDLASANDKVRSAGVDYFDKVMRKMLILESDSLAGAIYSYWPSDFVTTDKEAAWDRSIEALRQVGKAAERLNITIGLEVLNRNETYIMTTAAEAVEYCDRVGSDAIQILLDTYHMNIEEDDMAEAIHTAGQRLAHFHVGENNRKLPGMNKSIDWKVVASALHAVNYDRAVVMEPFLVAGGSVGHSIRLWRDLTGGADEAGMDRYIATSLKFLRDNLA